APSLCRGAARGDPQARRAAAYPARRDRRRAARPDAAAARLQLPSALRLRAGALPPRDAGALGLRRGGTPLCLLVSAGGARRGAGMSGALLSVEHLVVEYGAGAWRVQAVSDVSFAVRRGETLGLVGESGCGKSTLGRAVLQLSRPNAGRVVFDGIDLTRESGEALRRLRRRLQLIFQDPIASLNPRRRVGDIVAEPLIIAGVKDRAERQRRVRQALAAVGLDADLVMRRRPHEFSGGQCQRIAIARALVLEPELLIFDEPVSALDVSIRAQILNLLEEMKARYGLTLIFIAHD